MLGIFEELPCELYNEIWIYAHKKNTKMVTNSIETNYPINKMKDALMKSTEFIMERLENMYSLFLQYWSNSLTKTMRNVHIYMWLKNFRLYKLIFGKQKMFRLFKYFNISSYVTKLLSNKGKNSDVSVGNDGLVLCKIYCVPKNTSPLSHFCETFIIKNGYNGKKINSWKKAFEVLWLENI